MRGADTLIIDVLARGARMVFVNRPDFVRRRRFAIQPWKLHASELEQAARSAAVAPLLCDASRGADIRTHIKRDGLDGFRFRERELVARRELEHGSSPWCPTHARVTRGAIPL